MGGLLTLAALLVIILLSELLGLLVMSDANLQTPSVCSLIFKRNSTLVLSSTALFLPLPLQLNYFFPFLRGFEMDVRK